VNSVDLTSISAGRPCGDNEFCVDRDSYTPELHRASLAARRRVHFNTIDDFDAVVASDLNFDRSLIAQHTGSHWGT
jgi:hypothetical protein